MTKWLAKSHQIEKAPTLIALVINVHVLLCAAALKAFRFDILHLHVSQIASESV